NSAACAGSFWRAAADRHDRTICRSIAPAGSAGKANTRRESKGPSATPGARESVLLASESVQSRPAVRSLDREIGLFLHADICRSFDCDDLCGCFNYGKPMVANCP